MTEKTERTRRMFGHLKAAAEAIERNDVEQMRMSELTLTGLLDLEVREPRHVRLVNSMVRELGQHIRGSKQRRAKK